MSARYGFKRDGTPKKKPGRAIEPMTIERCERHAAKRREYQRNYYARNRGKILQKAKHKRAVKGAVRAARGGAPKKTARGRRLPRSFGTFDE